MSAELAFNRSVDVHYGIAEEVAPGIRRIVANNPSPYTFLGTNTYLVGSEELAIIDPGPDDERHLQAIADATKGTRINHILVHPQSSRPLRRRACCSASARRRDLELRADQHSAWRRRSGVGK